MIKMTYSGIPVNIDPACHKTYEKLVSRAASKAEEFPFFRMPDLFMISACIGASRNEYNPLESKGREIFSGEAFDPDLEIPILSALAFHKEGDLNVLLNPRKVIEIAQGWANGGIKIVEDELIGKPALNPLDNLVDLVSDEIQLEFGNTES